MPFLYKVKAFWTRLETQLLIAFSYRSELLTQAANFEETKFLSLSFRWNDERKQAVRTKGEYLKAWRLLLFSLLFHSNMHYWPSVRWSIWLDIWPNSCCATFMHWCSLRSLLRTYQRSTCSKSSIRKFKIRRLRTTNYGWTSVVLCL